MKKLLLLAIIAIVTFASCDKNDDYVFKTDAYVYLPFKGQSKQVAFSGDQFRKFKVGSNYSGRTWTAHEIVREEWVSLFYNSETGGFCGRAFDVGEKDTINDMLLWQAACILTADGKILRDFLYAENMFITAGDMGGGEEYIINNPKLDTVGYIPNATIIEARKHIEELYDAEKYDEIYEYFHHAFEIIPCTGSEYKALVEQGLQ